MSRRACGAVGSSVLALLPGCINGPVRYSELGSEKYATLEFPSEAPAPLVPLAAAGGLAVDVCVAAGDTVAFALIVVFVGPYQVVESAFQPRAPTWLKLALPVSIPIGSVAYGLYVAVKPYNITDDLGWEEGPYGRKPGVKAPPPEPEPDR